MYILTVETHFGVRQYRFDDEQEALGRMRLWSKHPTFIDATVQANRTVQVIGVIQTIRGRV